MMENLCLLILLSNLISFSILLGLVFSTDTLAPSESLRYGDTLVSEGEVFELGFFSPAKHSNNMYLGIWYKVNPALVLWVANRNYPLSDSNGTLTVNNQGNLLLLNQMGRVVWSSNESRVIKNPVAQILDSGNLVVRDSRSSDIYLWQSFDHPTDTLFAGMKLGWDLNTGLERYLTSWKSSDDPSIGEFTYRINIIGLPQLILYQGSTRKFRSGPWNGVRFSGQHAFENRGFKPVFVFNENESYYLFEVSDNSIRSRVTMNTSGFSHRLILHNKSSTEWDIMYTVPYEKCDGYGFCGDNGVCKISSDPICECLEGFKPRSQGEWEVLNWSNGCVRKMPLDCHKGEDFVEIKRVKLPDLLEFSMNKNKSLKECKEMCLKNCSCTAYASLDVRGGGSGCLMWFGNLIDVRELSSKDSDDQVIYVRLAALEIKLIRHENRKKRLKITVALTTSGMCILGLPMLLWCIIRKIRTRVIGSKTKKEDIDIPLFDFDTIVTATNNFSPTCVIGEGGFGPVYKGILSIGKDVAIKRLSKNSGQGIEEFKNEIVLIAKLQHKNLVGLIGCCIKDEERMLIYEYMSNNSLDHFIFDHKKSYALLEWEKRYDIVLGIARGLLYLHEDSKLQIIHRDLKLSNILLDGNMNPKISDFGLARIFGDNERETKTKRVVGTYGYMSPEYAVDGKISKKVDVFSFGVVLLEIISGQRNRFFTHPDHYHNLLGHAWLLWSEGRALELLDSCLIDSCVESQVLRCIQVGLLCVQKFSVDRPAMASVVFMLANEEARLPQPKLPGFFEERSAIDGDLELTREELNTKNEITITFLDGR